MDSLLMEAWLRGLDPLPTIDEASASLARELVRSRGAEIGLGQTVVASLAVAASELVHNQLRHARRGQFAVRAIERAGVPGLEIIAADLGPGIADPRLALEGPGPSEHSLGAGLSGARRMVHEMDLDVRLGEGTAVRARAFAVPTARRREIGILGRPFPEERVSGDHAVFVREGDTVLCAVIDGIGHGPLAGDAAAQAAGAVLANAGSGLASILEACDAALAGTRGAVMALARIDEAQGTVEHASVGNVGARIEGFRHIHRLPESASSLGRRGQK
ncbi:MAG TPA: hypothetical protein VKV34_09875, partial [Thermoleophilia bacterium]|nr:hypothetical protein [Thermoleophilia bacterium]